MFKTYADNHLTTDSVKYWDQLEKHNIVPIEKYIYGIDINCKSPAKYAVVAEGEVLVYDLKTNALLLSLKTIKDGTCCKFRSDGKMLLIGTKIGKIILTSTETTEKLIRPINAHSKSITRLLYLNKFEPVQKYSASISEDGALKIHDILTTELVMSYNNSHEPLRALATTPSDGSIIATGSLDGHIRIYNIDNKSQSPIIDLDTGYPINCLRFPFPGKWDSIMSSSGSSLFLWATGDNQHRDQDNRVMPMMSATPHHMQITEFCLSESPDEMERLVFTVAMDGVVKIISLGDFSERFQYECMVGLMGVRVGPKTGMVVVAGNNAADNGAGGVYIRLFKKSSEKPEELNEKELKIKRGDEEEQERLTKLQLRYCTADENLEIIHRQNRHKLSIYDSLLKKHRHRAVVQKMLKDKDVLENPDMFEYIIDELDSLNALQRSISNLPDFQLNGCLRLLEKYIGSQKYNDVCRHVFNELLKLYPPKQLVRQRFYPRVLKKLKKEIKRMKKIEQGIYTVKNFLFECDWTNDDMYDD